jgi:hypothetical protein
MFWKLLSMTFVASTLITFTTILAILPSLNHHQTSVPTTTPAPIPTHAPTTKAPTPLPTPPTSVPTQSPTHLMLDILWLIDGSSSMQPIYSGYEVIEDRMYLLASFITSFTNNKIVMSDIQARQGFIQYSGEYYLNNQYIAYHFINSVQELTSNKTLFLNRMNSLTVPGGTTNTSGILKHTRLFTLTNDNRRNGAIRVVVLVTDGYPSDRNGFTITNGTQSELEASQLKEEDDVFFVFLRIGNDYPANWFGGGIADKIYLVDSFNTLESQLLVQNFPLS